MARPSIRERGLAQYDNVRGPVNWPRPRNRSGSIGGDTRLSKLRTSGKGRAPPRCIYGDSACIADQCDQSSAKEGSMTACIVGWAHTPFGKLSNESVESLIVRVTGEALADAGVAARDVDEIVLGHFNAGFSQQDFTAALVLQASPDLRFKRATRVENACATGSAAVHQGGKAIGARSARIVLAVAAEHVQDFLPMSKRDILKFEGCAHAWHGALAKAGLKLGDLSFVETHDCFTIAELIEYEAMGLTAEGQG